MIHVYVRREHDAITQIDISGHANFADYGVDIVCAGVSAVALGNLRYLEKNYAMYVTIIQGEDGFLSVVVEKNHIAVQEVLAAMVEGLHAIEENYGAYIKIKK